uniref:Uncharacterized protein n=1 Tax=Lepeophtheirus salmonis TaxID=72036 RepID=A0A0K2V4L9_LEPSM
MLEVRILSASKTGCNKLVIIEETTKSPLQPPNYNSNVEVVYGYCQVPKQDATYSRYLRRSMIS